MSLLPPSSFGDAFLAGETIGFIEDHTRTCRRCGGEVFYGENDLTELGNCDDYLCPRCRDDYDWDDEEDYND